jgi:hypothetical protein
MKLQKLNQRLFKHNCNLFLFYFNYFNTCILHFLLFFAMTNQCSINLQIIILSIHVSTLLCHPQEAQSWYLAKLHKYVNAVVGNVIQGVYKRMVRFQKYIKRSHSATRRCSPPFSQECMRATQSCSPTALDRTCCKRRQPHTHTIWDEFHYRVDVCRVTQGAHIEGL